MSYLRPHISQTADAIIAARAARDALADLGQAVLDEHKAALAAERDLSDSAKKQVAAEAAAHVQQLLQELL